MDALVGSPDCEARVCGEDFWEQRGVGELIIFLFPLSSNFPFEYLLVKDKVVVGC